MFLLKNLHILNKFVLHMPVKFTSTYKIFFHFPQETEQQESMEEIRSSWCETRTKVFSSVGQWFVFSIHLKLLKR